MKKLIYFCIALCMCLASCSKSGNSKNEVREFEDSNELYLFDKETDSPWLGPLQVVCDGNAYLAEDGKNYLLIFKENPDARFLVVEPGGSNGFVILIRIKEDKLAHGWVDKTGKIVMTADNIHYRAGVLVVNDKGKERLYYANTLKEIISRK